MSRLLEPKRTWCRQVHTTTAQEIVLKTLEANPKIGRIVVTALQIERTDGSARVAWRWTDGGTVYHDLVPTRTTDFVLEVPSFFGREDLIADNDAGNTADLVLITAGTVDISVWAAGFIAV